MHIHTHKDAGTHTERARTSCHFQPAGLLLLNPIACSAEGIGQNRQEAARNENMEERICLGKASDTDPRILETQAPHTPPPAGEASNIL